MPRTRSKQRARGASRGATLVEYALAVTAICLAIVGAADLLTSAGQRELANQADCVSSRPPPPSCQIRAITTTTGVGLPTSASPTTAAQTTTTTIAGPATTTTTAGPTTTTAPTTTTTRPITTTTTAPPTTLPTTTTTRAPTSVNPTWTQATANPPGNTWTASADVLVRTGSTNVAGAVVTIQVRRTYEGGTTDTYTTTCTTGANGRCQFAESFRENGNSTTQVDGVRFRVLSVSGGTPAVTLGSAPGDLSFSNPA